MQRKLSRNSDLTAGVWSDDGSGNPSAELFTLTKPASIVAATNSGGPITA